MKNYEKGTVEYIYEMLPRDDCTPKEFRKAMGAIHNATKEWAKFYTPRVSESESPEGRELLLAFLNEKWYEIPLTVFPCGLDELIDDFLSGRNSC